MTVRVGFLGAGFIARYHAMQLRLASEPHEIVAVHDVDEARAAKFAADEGGTVVGDLDAVAEAADAVFVCTWTAAHLEQVRRLCDAGVAVFCEKPLSTDLDSARELVAVVAASRTTNMNGVHCQTCVTIMAKMAVSVCPSQMMFRPSPKIIRST